MMMTALPAGITAGTRPTWCFIGKKPLAGWPGIMAGSLRCRERMWRFSENGVRPWSGCLGRTLWNGGALLRRVFTRAGQAVFVLVEAAGRQSTGTSQCLFCSIGAAIRSQGIGQVVPAFRGVREALYRVQEVFDGFVQLLLRIGQVAQRHDWGGMVRPVGRCSLVRHAGGAAVAGGFQVMGCPEPGQGVGGCR